MSGPATTYHVPLRPQLRPAVPERVYGAPPRPVTQIERNRAILDAWASESRPSGGEIAASLAISRYAVLGVVTRARAAGDARAVRRPRVPYRPAAQEHA